MILYFTIFFIVVLFIGFMGKKHKILSENHPYNNFFRKKDE